MRITKANKIINATNETGDSDIPTYKQAQEILDCKDSNWEDFGFSCEEECQWFKRKAEKLLAKREEVNACKTGGSAMRITKATKTSVKASNNTSDYKQCLKDALVAKGGYKKSDVADQSTATLESWAKDAGIDIDNVCACGDIKASTSTDKALQHIKAAIDILGTSGDKSDVTKDSIANLSVVMFDLKSKN